MSGYIATAKREDWGTPPALFSELHAEFNFTIDAAASPVNAKLPRYWTIENNALLQDWRGERVFCNPPYGKTQKDFIRKAAECKADIAVLLIPARTDTLIWHECIFNIAEIEFIKGRLRFEGATGNAPFPSAVVIYRKR